MRRDNGICWICEQPGATTCDHVKPVRAGGATILSNLKAAHRRCNTKRGAPHPNEQGRYDR